MDLKLKFKRLLSGALSLAVIATVLPSIPAAAEEPEKYSYSMFGRNGIAMTANNLCMNGNVHTNKDADITSVGGNINGKITTGNDIEKRIKHVYADQKIMETYFTENCDLYEEEYVYSDMNIHINNPIFCYNNISLDGNVALNSNLGSLMNINVTGEVKNANTSVVYSKYGDITIENDSTANINGLIYAPLGTLTINSPNINLNGVIIADRIVINGGSVNINYKDDIASFIGTTSEVYDFSGLEYLPEEWLGDSDEDDLFDIYEKVIDTDPFDSDTDDDGLPDGYEVITLNTDPLEVDTDENGVTDADEDFDSDNLSNLGEYQNKTKPFNSDTDDDGFLDGDEIFTYGTDPLNPDTDNDGLLDGEESYDGSIYTKYGIYFDPLNPDTNGNGILDGDEVFGQSKRQEVETHDEVITEVNVDMDTNGNLEKNLAITSMYNIDAMSTNVYAMIGEPFNFTSATDFESATITFKVDQSKLGDTLFDNLIILWYNEEDQIFEEMPTTRDAVNSTVSTTTTHFSQYMVVDSVKWYENWDNSLNELRKMWIGNTSYQKNLNTIFLLDCSYRMENVDKIEYSIQVGYNGVTKDNYQSIISDMDSPGDVEYCLKTYGRRKCNRTKICENIINNMSSSDLGRVITFSNNVETASGYSHYLSYLNNFIQKVNNNGGYANLNFAVYKAFEEIGEDESNQYRIIVITDDNISFTSDLWDYNWNNTDLNFVNVSRSSMSANIENFAHYTGGDVYDIVSASDLTYESGGMVYIPEQFVGTDSDGDGIPDLVELYGLKPNGEPIGTNPYDADSDSDGISDNDELGYITGSIGSNATIADYVKALHPHSDPTKIDSDNDGITDDEEELYCTNAMNADTDGDGLEDGLELINWFDPLNANPDGDTYNDYEEYNNETDPYTYNLTAEEWAEQFSEGVIKGDFIEDPTVPQLLGQIAGSIAPGIGTVADIRDTIANVAHGHWFMAALSAIGVVPAAGDAIKSSSKAVNFITKNIDKTDEIADLIISVSKNFPDDFAKLIPTSSLDEIAEAFKKNNTMSHKTYDEIASILKKAGKELPTLADDFPEAKKVASNTDVWNKLPSDRGVAIDDLLGNNLGRYYPTYDKYDEATKIATSIKSIDPMCTSYKTASGFRGVLRKHARALMNGRNYVVFEGNKINNIVRRLELAFPNVPLTDVQKQVLDEFIQEYSGIFDIVITIIE